MIEPIKSEEVKVPIQRDAKGRFPKGVSGHPQGPTKGYRKAPYKEMDDAIAEYQAEHGTSYWKTATILALSLAQSGNVTLLCKILDKFVPTKIEVSEEDAPDTLPFMVCGPHAN
jgi:hypothetical protein